jgi:hypothetical protein
MNPLRLKRCIFAVALWLSVSAASGAGPEFVVKDVDTTISGRKLQISARVDLTLSEAAERAVDNGVSLTVLTEFELQTSGALWNETVVKGVNRTRLRYHALSSQYVVEDGNSNRVETYRTVADALRRMGSLRTLTLDLPPDGADQSRYRLAVRSRLDINALPPPLRTMAFFSPDWRLASNWTQWQINP